MGKEARYETVTPTWEGLLPVMLMAIRDGDTKAKTAAMGELRQMARIADVAVARLLAEEAEVLRHEEAQWAAMDAEEAEERAKGGE